MVKGKMGLGRHHRYLSLILAIFSILIIVLAELAPIPNSMASLKSALISVGTALLALSFIELIFKNFLQQELIGSLVEYFKKSTDLPVTGVYLRRGDMPPDQSPMSVVRSAREVVYIKAISFSSLVAAGFMDQLEDHLESENKSLKVRFIYVDPDSIDMAQITSLNRLPEANIRSAVSLLSDKILELKEKGFDVSFRMISYYPTSGYWLTDPDTDNSILKLESYLHHGESKSDRINMLFRRADDARFYKRITKAIKDEWKDFPHA